jgi:hypothetical protein
MTRHNYNSNGVTLNPSIPTFGDKVKVVYNGLLAESGATELFAHVGFGNNWNSQYDYRMNRTQNGFEASIPVTHQEPLNICFRDCANNWDNNSGSNYSYTVTE